MSRKYWVLSIEKFINLLFHYYITSLTFVNSVQKNLVSFVVKNVLSSKMSRKYWVLSIKYWVLSIEYWVLSIEYWVLSIE